MKLSLWNQEGRNENEGEETAGSQDFVCASGAGSLLSRSRDMGRMQVNSEEMLFPVLLWPKGEELLLPPPGGGEGVSLQDPCCNVSQGLISKRAPQESMVLLAQKAEQDLLIDFWAACRRWARISDSQLDNSSNSNVTCHPPTLNYVSAAAGFFGWKDCEHLSFPEANFPHSD